MRQCVKEGLNNWEFSHADKQGLWGMLVGIMVVAVSLSSQGIHGSDVSSNLYCPCRLWWGLFPYWLSSVI